MGSLGSRFVIRRAQHLALEFEISLLLVAIRSALRLLPFRTVYRAALRVGPAGPSTGIDHHSWQGQVTRAIDRIGRGLLGDSACLTQALVALILFRRRGLPAELRMGVKKDDNGTLQAHAWLETQGAVVLGGTDVSLACYAPLQSWHEAEL